MKRIVPAIALLSIAFPLAAQQPAPLTLDQRMSLRCSAAFALIARGQETGDPVALAYPPLGVEAREYFVRAAAKVMDEAGLDEAGIGAALAAEARDLVERRNVDAVMRACLPQLGLPASAPRG